MTENIRFALRARPGVTAVLAMAAGIALGRGGQLDPAVVILLSLLFIISIILAGRWHGLFYLLCALAGAALILRNDRATFDDGVDWAGLKGVPAVVEAEVITADSERLRNVRMKLRLRKINGVHSQLKAMAYLDYAHPMARGLPGDIYILDPVRLFPISGFRNEGNWDYESYVKDQGIGARISITKTAKARWIGQSWSMAKVMEGYRRQAGARLAEIIVVEDTLAVAKAMLTGDQGYVDSGLRDIYSRAGTAHLLSVSGLHVGFITAAFYFILKAILFLIIYPLSKPMASAGVWARLAAAMTLPVIWLFLLFTGPPLPATRAGIMIGTYMLAVTLGRPREFYWAFAASMGLILAIWPWSLFTVSFQLSFASIFFITLFLERYFGSQEGSPRKQEMARLAPGWSQGIMQRYPLLASSFFISIFAAVGSGPLVIYHFHIASLVGPLANPPVVILGSLATPAGIAGLIFDSEPLIALAAWLISLVTAISYWFGRLPSAYTYAASLSPAACAIFYISVGCLILSAPGAGRKMALAGAILAILSGPAMALMRSDTQTGMRISFLDMGQGDCTLITWPGGAAAVDAGGASPSFDSGKMVAAPALWRLDKKKLDAFFATHGDYDHVGGAAGLL
ncbi:MAG: ComEC/Rec2 family competence protein, partial [Nitrospinota bacterium]|nr:ComEC/Rec2 family competence protein [Nitrospinota bacterium]